MNAEIVMIGTELLLGQIVDTNASHMAQVLAENGINIYQKTTVGDNRERILRVLDAALDRADVILTSGGLGPTEDDITRDCVAELTGRPLELRDDLREHLATRFSRMRRTITDNNWKQAYAPRGAEAIPNPNGTAPGLIVEDPRGIIICMPGVPRELYAMLEDSVLPFLRNRFALDNMLEFRILKVCGEGESRVDSLIGDLITAYENPKIGLLANPESVRIRISARARNREEAEKLIHEADERIQERLPGLIMGTDGDTIETVVNAILKKRGWTLALGETHTGGMMAQRLVAAGATQFVGARMTPPDALYGSGPEDAAVQYAAAVRGDYPCDCVLVVVADVEEGQAHARFESPEGVVTWNVPFARMDELSQLRSSVICLEYLRRHLLGVPIVFSD